MSDPEYWDDHWEDTDDAITEAFKEVATHRKTIRQAAPDKPLPQPPPFPRNREEFSNSLGLISTTIRRLQHVHNVARLVLYSRELSENVIAKVTHIVQTSDNPLDLVDAERTFRTWLDARDKALGTYEHR